MSMISATIRANIDFIKGYTEKVVFGTIKFEENGTTGQLLKDALSILCCSVSANIFYSHFTQIRHF